MLEHIRDRVADSILKARFNVQAAAGGRQAPAATGPGQMFGGAPAGAGGGGAIPAARSAPGGAPGGVGGTFSGPMM
jgi:hypothetical protein